MTDIEHTRRAIIRRDLYDQAGYENKTDDDMIDLALSMAIQMCERLRKIADSEQAWSAVDHYNTLRHAFDVLLTDRKAETR